MYVMGSPLILTYKSADRLINQPSSLVRYRMERQDLGHSRDRRRALKQCESLIICRVVGTVKRWKGYGGPRGSSSASIISHVIIDGNRPFSRLMMVGGPSFIKYQTSNPIGIYNNTYVPIDFLPRANYDKIVHWEIHNIRKWSCLYREMDQNQINLQRLTMPFNPMR